MAKYLLNVTSVFNSKFNAVFRGTGIRIKGSRGGATFQKIGGVYCIRHRSVPTDKRRERQTAQRQRFDVFQKFWRTLDSMEKQTFRDEAPSYPRINSLGVEYEISGINLQQSSNTFLHTAGENPITEAQPPNFIPAFTIDQLTLDISSGIMVISILPATVPAGFSFFVYATRTLSQGALSNSNTYTLIGVISAGLNPGSFNWLPPYELVYGSVDGTEGQIFSVALQLIDLETGQPGTTVYGMSSIITN